MKLYGTPLSHFTRKLRILFAELDIDYEFVRTPGVLAPRGAAYGGNPLMRIPTLLDGDVALIDSDHIARHVVATRDPSDRFGVRTTDPRALNRLATVNGIMANEVVLILAKRAGHEDIDGVAYFRKLREAIDGGLAWLDANATRDGFDYADMALVAMWQHAEHYAIAPLAPYPRLAARVARLAVRPSVASTAPAQSLAEAKAAGWSPA